MTGPERRLPVWPWLLVGVAFLALALSFSARAALSLVMPLWDSELGWSRSFVSGAGAATLVVAAGIAPVVGRLADRYGPRIALSAGLAALAAGSFMVAVAGSRTVFLFAFSFVSAIGFGICGYATTGVIETHFLPYASFCGFAPLPGATAYGLLSAVNMVGMIAAGWLTDRMNRPLLLGTIYIARGLTFILLMNVGASLETLLVFAVLFGAVDYATVPVTASLVASHLGLRVMGLAMGLISAGHSIGGAAGAFLGGYLFDIYARYDWVWMSSLAVAVLAGLIVLLLRDRPGSTTAPVLVQAG